MVFVTPGIRWAIGIWSAVALGVVAGAVGEGIRPTWVVLLLALVAAPPVVLASFTRFRREARTSTQVLYDKGEGAGVTQPRGPQPGRDRR